MPKTIELYHCCEELTRLQVFYNVMMEASSNSTAKGCCLKICIKDPDANAIADDCCRVEVKAFEPKKKKDKFLVTWASDGSAMFHSECWRSLVKATKSNNTSGDELTNIERTMVLEAKKTAEFYDADSTIAEEAVRIASILENCGYCVAFTGAGISTAAGYGDFRGINGTWTSSDRQKKFGKSSTVLPNKVTASELLRPTYTHEALVKLIEMGILKYIISQNGEGLHRLSGVPKEKIAELHGNVFMERCEDCETRHELKHHYKMGESVGPFPEKKCSRCNICHRTGRKCTKPDCNGYMMNTIINFGDDLEPNILRAAERHAELSDVALILGTSLRVSPANDLVMMGQQPHQLILCNRQTTPYDDECTNGSRVFCDCDKLMAKVMEQLLPPSDFQKWEDERDTRMAEYDLKRSTV